MQDHPGLEYEKLIAQENRFYMTFYFALAGGASTLYLSFKQFFDQPAAIMFLGGLLFFLTIVATFWWKKVETFEGQKRSHISFLKNSNYRLRDFYEYQEAFLEEYRKRKKYHSVLPSTYYDMALAEILAKLSFGATILTLLYVVAQNLLMLPT